jgi:hypothetical protein
MNNNYDSWKTAAPTDNDAPEGCTKECEGCPECQPDPDSLGSDDIGPAPGTWAFTARLMAQGDDSGFDWDAWKDEMKERDGQ